MAAFANTHFAPDNFMHDGKKAVFVDFINVETTIEYNIDTKKALAQTIIEFVMPEAGQPIFDLKADVISAKLNANDVATKLVSDPDNATKYQLVLSQLEAGTHKLEIQNEVSTNIDFGKTSVQSAFWMSDLSDRKYIEQYIPTNIEYDQYQLNLEIKIIATTKLADHEVFTNGFLTQKSKNHYKISFPEYFTTSSFYFHLSKKDKFERENFRYESISGNSFPVVIYANSSWSLASAKKKTIQTLDELEAKLGAWSHPSLTIYIAGSGGMEHSGATITSTWALAHEITHSYFARGVMPADGNSGWLDEAIASWRDDGYQTSKRPNFSSTSMANHSQYQRTTDRKAYEEGAEFMAFLNHRLQTQGGLISFLNSVYKQYVHKNITTQLFKKELELFSGEDFTKEFNQYIFGKALEKDDHLHSKDNPYHPKLTKEELFNLL